MYNVEIPPTYFLSLLFLNDDLCIHFLGHVYNISGPLFTSSFSSTALYPRQYTPTVYSLKRRQEIQ
jgi:hypothetical protein